METSNMNEVVKRIQTRNEPDAIAEAEQHLIKQGYRVIGIHSNGNSVEVVGKLFNPPLRDDREAVD